MMSLHGRLPPPVHQDQDGESRQSQSRAVAVVTTSNAPPYGHRKGWIPRRADDFGDGGAFPEIHVAQHPLGMALSKTESNALTMQLDAQGKIRYDALARQGHAKGRVVHTKFTDLLPKPIEDDDPELQKPDEDTVQETAEKTREAMQQLVQQKLLAAAPVRCADRQGPVQYVRYTPAQQGTAYNSGAKQRTVQIVDVQKDPMEPPRFKINKKIPRGPPSPPPPVLHSPPRKLTVKEQQDWKIPPCISNWKNPRGYTIPLDKRVAADGRGLQTIHINEGFTKLAEALCIAERKAREAVEMRAQIEKKVAQKEKEKKEEQLQKIAQRAREERAGIRRVERPEEREELKERDELRKDRARDRDRDRNLARASANTRNKVQKEKERDISEKIALGMPNARANAGPDAAFDSRLFNQTRGLDSGFAGGEDETYNVYDKAWRTDKDVGAHIYRPTKSKDADLYGGDLDTLMKTRKFVPDKEFSGSDRNRRLDGPVQFEKEEEDPFNLSEFLSEAKKGQKRTNEESRDNPSSSRKRDRRSTEQFK